MSLISSHALLDSIADGIVSPCLQKLDPPRIIRIGVEQIKERLRLLTRNHRQTTSPDLLGRADLVAAIRLFSRMLDELD